MKRKAESKYNPIVSIRVPESLIEEFRDVAKQEHFLDISDALRTLIRHKMLEHKDPYLVQIRKLRSEIKKGVESDVFGKEKLIDELEKIKDELLRGDL